MAAQREYLAVHTGYKFYHNEYENHTNHVLQLLTELYFELETFRELWAGKGPVDSFVEDILINMESIQRKFEGDLRANAPTMGVADPPAGRKGGKDKVTHHPAGSANTNRHDASTSSVVLGGEQISHLQSQQRRRSPSPLKLNLRKIAHKDLYRPLKIKIPPGKRSESAEGSTKTSSPPPLNTTSALPTNARSETEVPNRSLKRTTPSAPEAREENPRNDASTSETGKRWVHQPFQREYTTRGPITADTPRHEISPKHSPILPSRYSLRKRQKILYSEPQNSGLHNIPKRQNRKLKREGAFILTDLASVEAGFGEGPAKIEPKDTVALQNGKSKRRRDDSSQGVKEEGSRSQKRSRKY